VSIDHPEQVGSLFAQHGRELHGFLLRRTGDWATAEDLVSVVFLEAWRRREETAPDLPWLYGVATNVLHNQRRAARRHRAALERLPAEVPGPDATDRAAERIDAERQVRVALEAIAVLPPDEQDVLVLCAWQGLSHDDAARALGIPAGTVKSRLSRARARLVPATRGAGR